MSTTDRTDAPLAAPRDIEGNPESTFVRCPDCSAAVYNLRGQRQAHLRWHDDLDADVASAQEAAQQAQESAERAEAALTTALAELARLSSPTDLVESVAIPLVGDWPADEIADRHVPAPEPEGIPDTETPTEGEPVEDAAAASNEDDDDSHAYVELPARRF